MGSSAPNKEGSLGSAVPLGRTDAGHRLPAGLLCPDLPASLRDQLGRPPPSVLIPAARSKVQGCLVDRPQVGWQCSLGSGAPCPLNSSSGRHTRVWPWALSRQVPRQGADPLSGLELAAGATVSGAPALREARPAVGLTGSETARPVHAGTATAAWSQTSPRRGGAWKRNGNGAGGRRLTGK